MASTPDTGERPSHDAEPGHRSRPTPNAREVREHVSIWIARLLSYIVSILPLGVGYAISDRIGDVLYWRSRTYRLNVIDNLRHVYGDEITELQLRRRARMVFRNSSRNFYDLIRSARMSREDFRANIRIAGGGWATIDQVRAEGRGGIFVTGHLGAFDSVGQILFVNGYDPYILTMPTVGKFVYAGVHWLRSRNNARLEDVSSGAIRRLLRALKRGEFIGLVVDRDFSDQGLPVTFFGTPTTLPAGPVRLARDAGVPILPVFTERGAGSQGARYLFHIADPIRVPKTDDEDADLQQGIQEVATVFERYIRRMPEQWVMFQRVWHDAPRRRRPRTKARAFLDRVLDDGPVARATEPTDS